VDGAITASTAPIDGDGARFMFDTTKGAIRGGTITTDGTQWDNDNRGEQSVAFGLDTSAKGAQSTVSGGQDNTAGGIASTVGGGKSNNATGAYSVAMGHKAKATLDNSFVFGGDDNVDTTSLAANTATFGFPATGDGRGLYYLNTPIKSSDDVVENLVVKTNGQIVKTPDATASLTTAIADLQTSTYAVDSKTVDTDNTATLDPEDIVPTLLKSTVNGTEVFNLSANGSLLAGNGNVMLTEECICVMNTDTFNIKTQGSTSQIAINTDSMKLQQDVHITPQTLDISDRHLYVKNVLQDTKRSCIGQLRTFSDTAPQITMTAGGNKYAGWETDIGINVDSDLSESSLIITDEGLYKIELGLNYSAGFSTVFEVSVLVDYIDETSNPLTKIIDKIQRNQTVLSYETINMSFYYNLKPDDILYVEIDGVNGGETTIRNACLSVERIQENRGGLSEFAQPPAIIMQDNTYPPPFVVDQSMPFHAGQAGYFLFDNAVSTHWHSGPWEPTTGYYVNDDSDETPLRETSRLSGEYNTAGVNSKTVDGVVVKGEWVSLDFGDTRLISKYRIEPRVGDYPGVGHPKRWTLCGTLDNSDPANTNWYTIDEQHLSPGFSLLEGVPTQQQSFTLETPREARHIAFIVTRIFPSANDDHLEEHYTSFAGLIFE
jgi:hypothetical protein